MIRYYKVLRKIFLVTTFFLFALLLSSKESLASESSIRVSGYQFGTAWLPLVQPNLNPPLSYSNTYGYQLYLALKHTSNFGPSGTVPCTVDFVNQVSSVTTESLVDQNGNLLVDVFWGGAKFVNVTDEEATELAKFVSSGGILYITGGGWTDTNTPGRGPEYNLLFEKLGIADRFEADHFASGDYVQTTIPLESVVTRGPFGTVNPMLVDSIRKFATQDLNGIVSKTEAEEFIVHEKKIGKGYLVVTGSFLYSDYLITHDYDNTKYYMNLFALGCGEQDFGKYEKVVLDVPSFKQGLYEYDGADPAWENETYDDGDKQNLFCDTNGDGAKMYECACALTSATMVMKYNSIDKLWNTSDVNPQSVNNYFTNFSTWTGDYYKSYGYTNGNVNWQAVSTATADANINYANQTKLDQPMREDFSLDKIKQFVDSGTPVIQQVTGQFGLHWVVIKGYEPGTDRLVINDPAYPDPVTGYSYLDEKYTPIQSRSMITYAPTQSDFRYLQFVSPSLQHLLVVDNQGRKTGFDAGITKEEIPNSQYIFEGFYGDPSNQTQTPASSTGMNVLTIQMPEDGGYQLSVNGDGPKAITIYSSDKSGNSTSTYFTPFEAENYGFEYDQTTAGSQINLSIDTKIDILPLVKQNLVIPHKLTPIPVAILALDNFNLTQVDKTSLTFGKTGDEHSLIGCQKLLVDVNRDRKKDLICYFAGDKVGLDTPDTVAYLKGKYENINFEGSDMVKVIKPWFLF